MAFGCRTARVLPIAEKPARQGNPDGRARLDLDPPTFRRKYFQYGGPASCPAPALGKPPFPLDFYLSWTSPCLPCGPKARFCRRLFPPLKTSPAGANDCCCAQRSCKDCRAIGNRGRIHLRQGAFFAVNLEVQRRYDHPTHTQGETTLPAEMGRPYSSEHGLDQAWRCPRPSQCS